MQPESWVVVVFLFCATVHGAAGASTSYHEDEKLAENIYSELGMGTEVCANGLAPGTPELISFIRCSVLCSTTCAMIFRSTYFMSSAGMQVCFF